MSIAISQLWEEHFKPIHILFSALFGIQVLAFTFNVTCTMAYTSPELYSGSTDVDECDALSWLTNTVVFSLALFFLVLNVRL